MNDSGTHVSYPLFAFEHMCAYHVDFWKKMNVKDTGVSQNGMVLSQTVVYPINLNVYYRPKGEIIKLFNVYTE